MDLAYAAHSARCALLLDADGVCRWFVLKVDDESVAATAKRCLGAQFVATLDPDAEGLLGPKPTVGKSVLFARVDEGCVSLVRFGPLVQFDTLGEAAAAPQAAPEPVAPEPVVAKPVVAEPAPAAPAPEPEESPLAQSVILEPQTAEVPHLSLVPTPPTSEPSTLPSVATRAAVRDDRDDRETQNDLFDEDELATAAGEERAYRPSGFAIRAHDSNDGDNIETAAFARAVIVARASRRGMLPRRG